VNDQHVHEGGDGVLHSASSRDDKGGTAFY
jgi:hypothetical protein